MTKPKTKPKRRRAVSEPKADRLTMSVPEAGRLFFGLSRNASYRAALAGTIPSLRVGGRLFALVAPLERMLLGGNPDHSAAGRDSSAA
jgi:hypothetical protein